MKTNQLIIIVLAILILSFIGGVIGIGGLAFLTYRTMPVEEPGMIDDRVVATEETEAGENSSLDQTVSTAWSEVSISFRFYLDGEPMSGGHAEFIPVEPSESFQQGGPKRIKSSITPSGLCAGVLLEPGIYKVIVNQPTDGAPADIPAERYQQFETTPLTLEVTKGDDFQIGDDLHLTSD